ncbi:MAG TPA: hypothetical protein VFT59_00850 [Candidatus Saccharimonadales bacterium]|nr:hypothetical protein [Candidatus Saccharimonadales bacterium]
MTHEADSRDRIFSVPGTLTYILVKNNCVHMVIGNWARPLTCQNPMPIENGTRYDTFRGSFGILEQNAKSKSWWNGMTLVECR